MPSRYGSVGASLEPRRPRAVMMPLAGLLAGPLNPTALIFYDGMSGYMFSGGGSLTTWIIFQVVPMAITVTIALYYLRAGSSGLLGIAMLLFVALIAAAAGCAMTLAALNWFLVAIGVSFAAYPVTGPMEFALVAGTGVRLNLILNLASLIFAAVVIRLVAFQRDK